MLSRENVQLEAQKWLGVKWRHQGRTRNGIDCAGLIAVVGQALSYPIVDRQGYSRTAKGFDFLAEFQCQFDKISIQDAQPGDVLVFRDTYYPCHCGILTQMHSTLYLIHAHARRGRVVYEELDVWRQKWCNAFKFRGID